MAVLYLLNVTNLEIQIQKCKCIVIIYISHDIGVDLFIVHSKLLYVIQQSMIKSDF